MYDFDIDLDPSMFKGELADGIFLTKIHYNIDRNNIEATYNSYNHGEHINEYTVNFKGTYYNYQSILHEKYSSILKLIEINDKILYEKKEKVDRELKNYKMKYKFYGVASLFASAGALSLGYALANINTEVESLLPVILSSTCILLVGVYSKVHELESRYIYESNCSDLIDVVELKSENYLRIKE